jgi:hypothetical protein
MFQILDFTEARLATLTARIEKHGDDEKPAVSLGIEIETANTVLDCIDPTLRHALFKAKDENQEAIDGLESTPVLRSNSIDRVILPTKHEGWTLEVDDGVDDTTPLVFGGCKVDKFNVEPRQGGSITLRLRVGTSDLDAERSGMLGMHVGQSIWIKLRAPEKKAEGGTPATGAEIDGTQAAFEADHPDATDLFAQQHGGAGPNEDPDDEGEGSDPDAHAEQPSEPQRGENWPFPRDGAKTDGDVAGERDAEREGAANEPAPKRGRARRKAA